MNILKIVSINVKSYSVSIIAVALLYASLSSASPSILDPDNNNGLRLPDFSYAGYNHGVGEIPVFDKTVIDVVEYGAIANDGRDDSVAILKAIKVANEVQGPVVLAFPQGRIIVSEILRINRSNIVLRGFGSGEQGTELFFPRPLRIVDKGESLSELNEYLRKYDKRQKEKHNNINEFFSEYSWSGGFIWVQKEGTRAAPYLSKNDPPIIVKAVATAGKAGELTVTVKSSKKVKVGDVLELQWFNKKGEKGPLVNELYGQTDVKIGSRHWTETKRPLVRQKTQILAIDGKTLTISDPLLHTISDQLPAQFARWDHLTNVGIEDLKLTFPNSPSFGHHLEQGYNGVYFTSVFNGWIRNLAFANADSGILTYNSANLTISDIETTGDRVGHYSVHVGNVHNVLVRNLIVNNPVIHSLSLNTQSTKSVFLNSHVFKTPVLDQHAGANHQNLFDNTHLYVTARRDKKGKAFYPVWDGSGAGYWQPGHGRYNTTWNLKVNILGGAARTEMVTLLGKAEGPDARIVGISGNREFKVDYRPAAYMERLNKSMDDVPSLYIWQLSQRLQKNK